MTKDEILDYVMNSPSNTNRMVLSGMIDSLNEYDLVFETSRMDVTGRITKDTVFLVSGSAEACFNKIKSGKVCKALLQVREAYGEEFVCYYDVELENVSIVNRNDIEAAGLVCGGSWSRSVGIILNQDNVITGVESSRLAVQS